MDFWDDENVMKDYNLFYNNIFYSKKTKKQQLFQKDTAVNEKNHF